MADHETDQKYRDWMGLSENIIILPQESTGNTGAGNIPERRAGQDVKSTCAADPEYCEPRSKKAEFKLA